MELPRTGKVGATLLMAWTVLFSGNVRLAVAADPPGKPGVEIVVDGARHHQTYEGFGATTLSLVHRGGRPGYGRAGDSLGPKLRRRVLDALYGRVKLTMGNLSIGPLETPAGWDHRGNDNDDANSIHWKGFDTFDADGIVLATAFLDEIAGRVVLVIINNVHRQKALDIRLSGVQVAGHVTGEQSYAGRRWQPIEPLLAESPQRIRTVVPALSVTTLAAPRPRQSRTALQNGERL